MKYKARFLGTPEFFVDGQPLTFAFQKARILTLMLIEEKSISKDKICEYLWADKPIKRGRRNLSNALSYIRTIIPVHAGSAGMISLDPAFRIEKDIDRLCHIDTMDWNDISDLCLPFMDLAELDEWPSFSDWLLPKRQYYHNVAVENLKRRAAKKLISPSEEGYDDAVLCYEKLAEYEPYDEKIHGELVRLYIKTGQKVKAVDTARAYSMRIENDLGISTDLSDISSLMKRKTPGSNPLSMNRTFDDIPLARNAEMLKMLDFLSRTGAESCSSCGLVWGEQGIGKTVFIDEIASCLKEKGWECYFVRCSQEEKNRPMVPFIQLLQRLKYTPSQLENITSLTELNYSRLAELVYQQIAEVSAGRSKILIIENIQWMDEASWMILETIMWDHSAPRHLLISGFENIRSAFMIRTTLADEPFEEFEVRLKRFNLEETGQICRGIRPDRQWSDELIHEVYMQTEGNPFFIKELLTSNEGTEDQGVTLYKNPFLSVVERLDKDERLFMEAMAVSSEPASMLYVAKLIDMSPLQISNIYENIKVYELLREKNEEGDVLYYFTHVKIREILLKNMSFSRKQALHLKNIMILEESALPLLYRHRNIYKRLYYHCHDAGLNEKELLWRVRELKLHFMAAHEVFPTLIDQDLMYYIPSLDDVDYTNRSLSSAWELMNKVSRSGVRSHDLDRIERDLYILQGAYHWWEGRYEDSRQMLTEGLRKALKIGEQEAAIEAVVQMCYLAIQTDNAQFLHSCASKVYRISQKEHLHQWLGISLRFLAIAKILEGKHSEAERLLQMSTLVFEKLEEEGSSYTVCLIAAEHFRGDMKLASGDIEGALSFYMSCINIGESIGLYRGLGLSLAKSAFCLMLLGNFEEAEKYLLRMEKFYNLIHSDLDGGLQGSGIALGLMGLINSRKGDWEKARIYFTLAQKLVAKTRRPTWQAVLCWSKLELFRLSLQIPEDFAKDVLNKEPEWYLNQLEQMKHKVGWVNIAEPASPVT